MGKEGNGGRGRREVEWSEERKVNRRMDSGEKGTEQTTVGIRIGASIWAKCNLQ